MGPGEDPEPPLSLPAVTHMSDAEFHLLSQAFSSFRSHRGPGRVVLRLLCCLRFAEWLQSSVFSGGLQTSQIHYSYNEEKDEDHCSSPGGTPASKSRLCSHGRALGDHSQAFLQALADNNVQDHSVKVSKAVHTRRLPSAPGLRPPSSSVLSEQLGPALCASFRGLGWR